MSPETKRDPMEDELDFGAMSCGDALEFMPFLDDEAGSQSWERVESHASTCDSCNGELDSLKRGADALAMAAAWRRASETDAVAEEARCPIDLWPGVALALGEAGGDEKFLESSDEGVSGAGAPGRSRRRGGRGALGGILTLALAASFLVVVGFGIAHRLEQLEQREENAVRNDQDVGAQIADHGEIGGKSTGFSAKTTGSLPHPEPGRDVQPEASGGASWLAASSLDRIIHGLAVSLMVPADIYGGAQLLVPAQSGKGDPENEEEGEPSRYLQRELVPVSGDVRMKF